MAEIKSINDLLQMKINIPSYQRPYKWTAQNIKELLEDISIAIDDSKKYNNKYKYRIGTIIFHKNNLEEFDVVDGQQRIISLALIRKCIDPFFKMPLLKKKFINKFTQANIHNNYMFIREWFSIKSYEDKVSFINAFENILEVVVLSVRNISEAFQLFDSQNTRGKALEPHDILKAYHLREMKKYPYEMKRAVNNWELKRNSEIRDLFNLFLFPIWNWSRGVRSREFTVKDIDIYKGVSESSTYSYAKRTIKSMPYFQINEPFISGKAFFEMVDYYLYLLTDIKTEILNNSSFSHIKFILCNGKKVYTVKEMEAIKYGSVGFKYTKNLFYCALLCYYDKFNNFDEMAVKKLFTWAFMLRVDMENLGFDSVNKYAIGNNENSRYTNSLEMFSKISLARIHKDISSLQIKVKRNPDKANNEKWNYLYNRLKVMNGLLEEENE